MNIGKLQLTCSGLAVAGVNSTGVWTNTFKIGFGTNFGCMVQCSSAGTPQIQIKLEESYYDLKVNNIAQGAADSHYVVPDGFPDIFSQISDTLWHLPAEGITPIPMMHARYKIIGLSGNPSDTTVTIYTFIQELGRTFGG